MIVSTSRLARTAAAAAALSLLCSLPARADQAPPLAPAPTPLPKVVDAASPPEAVDPAPLPQPLATPTPSSWTLPDLEQAALNNNPSLVVACARVRAARGRMIQSGLYPNPSVGYMAEDMGEDNTAGQQGGFVSQQFILGKKLQLNRAMGARDVREQQFLYTAQELRVLSDVRLRFYEALAAQRRVALGDELVAAAGQVADSSRKLLEGQQMSQSDVLLAEVESQEAEIVAANARNQLAEAWRRLGAVMGATGMPQGALVGALDADIPTYEWDEVQATVLATHPELAAAGARVQRARIAITAARRKRVPDLSITTIVEHQNQTGDDVAGVQAGIPLPVFDANQGNIMAAQAELIAAENSVRQLELNLQDRLAIAYRQYANARQQVDRYKSEILPRAQKSYELMSAGRRAGQVDFLSLLTSQRTFIRVNLAYVDALAQLWQSTVLIEGQLLSDSLESRRVLASSRTFTLQN